MPEDHRTPAAILQADRLAQQVSLLKRCGFAEDCELLRELRSTILMLDRHSRLMRQSVEALREDESKHSLLIKELSK